MRPYNDYEDDETATMYPPGHHLEPVRYMRKYTIARHPRALESRMAFLKAHKKRKERGNENNKPIR